MKRANKLVAQSLLTSIIVSTLLCGCSNGKQILQMPVQLENSSMWSIIDVESGTLIQTDFSEEKPNGIANGILTLKNSDGNIDYYNVDNVNTPLNKESFSQALDFFDYDYSLAVLPGECISIINRKGEVVKTLDKSIKEASIFHEGLSTFSNQEGKSGVIDTKGSIVVKPIYDGIGIYNDGVAIAAIEEGDKITIVIIDKKGKELCKFNAEYKEACYIAREGMLPVSKDGKVWFINYKGETVLNSPKCEGSASEYTYSVNNGTIIFKNDGRYGIMDLKGNILIRAKYRSIVYAHDDKYIAKKEDKMGIIDINDNVILPFEYKALTTSGSLLEGVIPNRYFAKTSGESLFIIDENGKEISKEGIKGIVDRRTTEITSEFFDVQGCASLLTDLIDSAGNFDGFKENTACGEIAKKYNREPKSGDESMQMFQFDPINGNGVIKVFAFTQFVCSSNESTVLSYNPEALLYAASASLSLGKDVNRADEIIEACKKNLAQKGYKDNGKMMEKGKNTAVVVSKENSTVGIVLCFDKSIIDSPEVEGD